MRAERGEVGIRGPGQTADKHRQWSDRRLHPAVGSGRADCAVAAGLRAAEDDKLEPAVAGPFGALRVPQLRIRGGETSRQTPGAYQEEGELLGEFL